MDNMHVAVGDNLRVWVVTLTGAKGTIFAGEKYKLKVCAADRKCLVYVCGSGWVGSEGGYGGRREDNWKSMLERVTQNIKGFYGPQDRLAVMSPAPSFNPFFSSCCAVACLTVSDRCDVNGCQSNARILSYGVIPSSPSSDHPLTYYTDSPLFLNTAPIPLFFPLHHHQKVHLPHGLPQQAPFSLLPPTHPPPRTCLHQRRHLSEPPRSGLEAQHDCLHAGLVDPFDALVSQRKKDPAR